MAIADSDDETFNLGFEAGCEAARAGMNADLRSVIDFVTAELRALRIEICRAAGLPLPPKLDPNGRELQ